MGIFFFKLMKCLNFWIFGDAFVGPKSIWRCQTRGVGGAFRSKTSELAKCMAFYHARALQKTKALSLGGSSGGK